MRFVVDPLKGRAVQIPLSLYSEKWSLPSANLPTPAGWFRQVCAPPQRMHPAVGLDDDNLDDRKESWPVFTCFTGRASDNGGAVAERLPLGSGCFPNS